jgi:D-glycerate 3-kinase
MSDANQPSPDRTAALIEENFAPLLDAANRPLVLGLAGAQGSGKSTVADKLKERLEARGKSVAVLSLDDLYFDRPQRARLARRVHPLFATRGVPGTHDVGLGVDALRALRAGRKVLLPRFDKGTDSKRPRREWPRIAKPVDVVIFEGWCVGAIAEAKAALAEPINELERREDASGAWRRHVNSALAGKYRKLFGLIDYFAFLRAPSFDIVMAWRLQQEHELAANVPAERLTHLMSDEDIARFIQHFERITRHMLVEAPGRADLTLQLDEARRVVGTTRR